MQQGREFDSTMPRSAGDGRAKIAQRMRARIGRTPTVESISRGAKLRHSRKLAATQSKRTRAASNKARTSGAKRPSVKRKRVTQRAAVKKASPSKQVRRCSSVRYACVHLTFAALQKRTVFAKVDLNGTVFKLRDYIRLGKDAKKVGAARVKRKE